MVPLSVFVLMMDYQGGIVNATEEEVLPRAAFSCRAAGRTGPCLCAHGMRTPCSHISIRGATAEEFVDETLQLIGLLGLKAFKGEAKLQPLGPFHGCLSNEQWLLGSRKRDLHAEGLARDHGIIAEDPASHTG